VNRPRRAALAVAGLAGSVLLGSADPAMAATPGVGIATTGGTALNVRAGVTASTTLIGTVANGGRVPVACFVYGQTIHGTVRSTRVWDRLTTGGYVSDAYVRRTFTPPYCPSLGTASTGAYTLPVPQGVISGFRTPQRPTHDGVDLGAPRFTAIHAVAAGRVITVKCNASTGNCDVDGGSSVLGCGWYVEIQHYDGVVTRYCHMVRQPSVRVGQTVAKGQVIGNVGMSGNAGIPHLHFEVHTGAPAVRANAIDPVPFMQSQGLTFGA
jgi:murein DD-endopeptidase MepM/ murein hydrolase activator NlpD